ncbi:hypothetical protein OSTOST_12371 [Ostertagia ostertagi]
MIVGNVRDEFRPFVLPNDEATVLNLVPPHKKARAAEIAAALKQGAPTLSAADRAATLNAMPMRQLALEQARKQHAAGKAAVYSYWFTFPTPVLDMGCPHTSDVAFAFDNTARADQSTGNTPAARQDVQPAQDVGEDVVAFVLAQLELGAHVEDVGLEADDVGRELLVARAHLVDVPAAGAVLFDLVDEAFEQAACIGRRVQQLHVDVEDGDAVVPRRRLRAVGEP